MQSKRWLPVTAYVFVALTCLATLSAAEDKIIKLVHVESGKVLGVIDDSLEDRAQLSLCDDVSNEARQWRILEAKDFITLTNVKSGKVIDIAQASKETNGPLIQYPDKSIMPNGVDKTREPGGLENQHWVWDGAGKERRLRSKWSDLVLDADVQGLIVQRDADPKARSQLWRVAEIEEAVRPSRLLAAGHAPEPAQRAVLHLANGDYAAGELADGNNPDVIRWQTSIATRPFDFIVPAISAVHFPMRKDFPKANGDYCIELAGNDMLFGSIVSLSPEELVADCGPLGKLHIKRTSVSRLLRWGKTADVVYFGPNGMLGWQEPAKNKLWQDDAGVLATDKLGANIFGEVNLPPQAMIEVEISWKNSADFVMALGVGKDDEKSLRRAIRLEAWGSSLKVTREVDNDADLADLQEIKPGAGRVHLQIYLDQKKGQVRVSSPSGQELGHLEVFDGKAKPQTGIQIINQKGDVRLERLRIVRLSGEPPRDLTTDKPHVARADGSTVYGEVSGYDAATHQFVVSQDSHEIRVKADDISSVVLATPEPSHNIGMRAVLQNGSRLSGKIEKVVSGKVHFTSGSIKDPLSLAVSDLLALVVLNPEAKPDESAGRLGRLEMENVQLHGWLAPCDGASGPLVWRPQFSMTDSPLRIGISGRLIYRDPPPPEVQQAQEQQIQIRRLQAAQLAVQRPAVVGTVVKAFANADAAGTSTPAMYLRAGDVIPCKVTQIDEEGVMIQSEMTGTKLVPHDKIKAVEMAAENRERPLDKVRRERLLTLPRMQRNNPPTHLVVSTNGDYVRGRVTELNSKTLTMEVQLETRQLPRSNIAKIIWLHADELEDSNAKKDEGKKEAEKKDTDKKDDAKKDEAIKAEAVNNESKTDEPKVNHADSAPAPPTDLASCVQAVRSDGIRLTFTPQRMEGQSLIGTSDVLGPCRTDVNQVDELIIGLAIKDSAAKLRYGAWKLHHAVEPIYVNESSDPSQPDKNAGMQSPLVGKPAPDFELNLKGGGKFRVSERKGKILVLDFFATWCGPCVAAMPQVDAAVGDFKDQNVQLVAVNMQEDARSVDALLERLNLKPTVAMDLDGVAAAKYSVSAIPQTVIIDAEGNVARVFIGAGPNFGDQLREALKDVIGGKPDEKDAAPKVQTPPKTGTG